MLYHKNCVSSVFQFSHNFCQPFGSGIVQIGRWFIKNIYFWPQRINRTDCDLLLLSAGQCKDTPIQIVYQFQLFRRFCNAINRFFTGQSEIFAAEGQFPRGIRHKELRAWILEYRSNLSCQFRRLHFQQRMAIHEQIALDFSGIKVRNQTVERADQGCFAAAASPCQKNELTRLYGHINAAEGKVFAFFITKAKILK